MDGYEILTPTWVQMGEIGLAFVIVILATWLVIFVLRTSGDREKRYVEIINGFLPLMQSIADRLEDIEVAVGVDRNRRARINPKDYICVIELIVSIVGGLLLHQSKRVVDRMPHGWDRLAAYAIGVVGTLPFIGLFWRGLGDETKPVKRGFAAYLLGFIGVGAGVAAGWLIDTLTNNDD